MGDAYSGLVAWVRPRKLFWPTIRVTSSMSTSASNGFSMLPSTRKGALVLVVDAALIVMTGISISVTMPWRILQNAHPSTIGIMRSRRIPRADPANPRGSSAPPARQRRRR